MICRRRQPDYRVAPAPLSYRTKWTDGAVVRLQTEAGDLWPALLAQCRADLRGYAPERVNRALANLDVLAARAERIAHPPPAPPGSPLDGHELQAILPARPAPGCARSRPRWMTPSTPGVPARTIRPGPPRSPAPSENYEPRGLWLHGYPTAGPEHNQEPGSGGSLGLAKRREFGKIEQIRSRHPTFR